MPAANPGVLLLIADDWSPIAGCYHDPVVHTPHIDALARRATRFDQAFCTTPSCAASRANLLTGQYVHQHGQYGHSHGYHGFRTHEHLADQTLPAVLRKHGVFTGLIGKDHIAPKSAYPFHVDERCQPRSLSGPAEGVRRFLTAAGDRPFYLHVASAYPHRTGGDFRRSHDEGDGLSDDDVLYPPETLPVPNWLPDTPEVRQDLADYYTFVTRFDRFVGVVLAELQRSGRADETTIILTSDHGMPFPGAKGSAYDSGHHCPLIIAPPHASPHASQALVNWCDIYPTICDSLALPQADLPADLPGRSLLPILDQSDPPGWDQTFYSHVFHEITNYFPYRVLREKRFKFVRHLVRDMPMPSDLFNSPTWQAVLKQSLTHMGDRLTERVLHHDREELYDLANDPAETTNLVANPAFADTADRMRKTLHAFRERTNDPWLIVDKQEAATHN
ncbi:sulfatase [Phycisphaerales bacterium AB-hyl4]|uniref:Sulfatase n=1 Tax=Natronomicrosphaera hydrolytica TaxID=3242702 RepID=A0ABV4U4W1_9BACT